MRSNDGLPDLDRRGLLSALIACAVVEPSPALARLKSWPGGMISLTYDDGLDCHLDIAAPALLRHGLCATFYVSWINIAKRAPEWIALGRRGHEIANHTVHHRCDIGAMTATEFAEHELRPLDRWLDRAFGEQRDRDYAYPCDVTNLGAGTPNHELHRYKGLLQEVGIRSARTSEGPANSERWVRRAPYRLQALAIGYDTQSLSDVLDYIAQAQKRRRWAILIVHRIEPTQTSPEVMATADYEALLQAIVQSGMACRTVGQVMRMLD